MRTTLGIVAVLIAAAAGWLVLRNGSTGSVAAATIDRYCIDCHNPVDLSGNLTLNDKNPADVAHDAEVWERVVRKLRTGMMPPADAPRPAEADLDAVAAELEDRLDRAAANVPVRGPSALRRLNRTEYGNAIRDLLDLDVDPSTLLPLDDSSEGFDNIASSLGVSPSLIEAYVSSAMKLSRRALGDDTAPRTQVSYPIPETLRQNRHLDGLPLGTRGGMRFEHLFPLDADYEFRIRRGFGRGGLIDVTLDGEPVEVDAGGRFRLPVAAGPHELTVALVDTRRSTGVDDIYSAPESAAGVSSIEIDGPLNPTGIGDTPSRRKILICEPETAEDETMCARAIVSDLATRAFRRSLSPDEIVPLMSFYEAGRDQGFEPGLQQALARILVDPRFLYRIEPEPEELGPGETWRVDDFALASRLSFFLWSSIPDDRLLELAAAGELSEPATFSAELKRMLADPKAEALIDNFAAQWLHLRELESVTPDAPTFDENLRRSMARETELLVATILREDLSLVTLLDAGFTFIDDRLAEHYGYDGIRGSHFRRVELPADSPRRGVLGHASILTLTSVTNRTSPVIRGSWILENLIGSPAPTPPPNVETTLEGDDGTAVTLTVRERLEAHRANPVCASCHAIMDPLGFTLENYDLVGAWRDSDGGQPIDSSAVLTDGRRIEGPAELKTVLIDQADAFATIATEKLLTYALGRRIEYYDMPAIRAIVRDAAARDYRFSALIEGVVNSEQFRSQVTGGG